MNPVCGDLHAKGRYAQSAEIDHSSYSCFECKGVKWNSKDRVESAISPIEIRLMLQWMVSDALKCYGDFDTSRLHPFDIRSLCFDQSYQQCSSITTFGPQLSVYQASLT